MEEERNQNNIVNEEIGNETVKQLDKNIEQEESEVILNKRLNVLGLVSFICSLVGIFILGIPCGTVAIITGILCLVKFNPSEEKGKWMGIVGLVVGVFDVVTVVISIILQMAVLFNS